MLITFDFLYVHSTLTCCFDKQYHIDLHGILFNYYGGILFDYYLHPSEEMADIMVEKNDFGNTGDVRMHFDNHASFREISYDDNDKSTHL